MGIEPAQPQIHKAQADSKHKPFLSSQRSPERIVSASGSPTLAQNRSTTMRGCGQGFSPAPKKISRTGSLAEEMREIVIGDSNLSQVFFAIPSLAGVTRR
ncbi:MAG: hypothetical protein JO124_02565 [Hyphomicrobiales bacterium]|nr:hypothetical protein [Hyphomicrobiales bacterium]MBV9977229.1 hypothetical protein [Hyphomicrobiales bacterium]